MSLAKQDSLQITRSLSSLREQVTDMLREAIIEGRFAPGSRLVERELCELLGVSRTLVREALQHLQAEGLITTILHKGPMVSSISPEEARDIYEVRQRLEAMAGADFARHATDDQVRALRESLDFLKTPEAAESTSALVKAKNSFYKILLEGCRNQVVGQLLTQLNNRITLLRRISLGHSGRLSQTLSEIEAIVSAIEARDAELAGALCSAHVAKAAAVVAQHLKVDNTGSPAISSMPPRFAGSRRQS